jgi:hypothetical protein
LTTHLRQQVAARQAAESALQAGQGRTGAEGERAHG